VVAALERADRTTILGGAALALVMAFLAYVIAPATPLRIGFGIAVAVAPVLLYLAVRRPLIFPYALLVMVAPFEELAVIPGFGTISKTLGFVAGASLVISLLIRGRAVPPPRTLLAWGALIAWIAFSAVWSIDQNASLLWLAQNAELIALYVMISITPADDLDLGALTWAAIVGGGASAAFGIYLFLTNPSLIQDGNRLYIAVGHQGIDPNHYANALLPAIAILMMSFLAARRLADKAVFGFAAAMIATGVFLSGSREALVAIGAILIYFALRSAYRKQAWLITAFFAGLALGMPNVLTRFLQGVTDGGAGRTSIWAVALEALRSNWLLGSGAGTFSAAYDQAFLHVFQPHFAGWGRAAHNTPLEFAVELGVIGFAVFAVCWFSHFRLLRTIQPGSRFYDLRIAFEGALFGLTIASFFISAWTYKYVWIAFSLILILRSRALVDAAVQKMAPQIDRRPALGPGRSAGVPLPLAAHRRAAIGRRAG